MEFGFIIVVMLGIVGLIVFLSHHFEQQRIREYQAAARQLGLEFFPKGDDALKESLGEFSLFRQGHGAKLKNLIRGQTQSANVAIFDYSYTTGGGDSSSTTRQTVIRFESSFLQLPKFELRPEHMGHRLAKLFGYQDIAIPEFPAFSRQYLLQGENEEAIRELFSLEIIAHLERLEGLFIAGQGSQLIVYRPGKRLRGHELRDFLEEAFGIYTQFKTSHSSEVR